MQSFPSKKTPKTIVLRHKKENLKKCTLRALEKRGDFHFLTYPAATLPNLHGYLLLTLDASPLTPQDGGCGLLILDGTWRYVQQKLLPFVLERRQLTLRSIPKGWHTAYPRRQADCIDPACGLASIEALYAAYKILGRDCTGLFDHYYWREKFLEKNQSQLFS